MTHQNKSPVAATIGAAIADESRQQVHVSKTQRPLTAREYRVLSALLAGPISREEVDGTAPASNGPAIIAGLRERNIDIHTELVPFITKDGVQSRYGVYHLKKGSRPLVRKLLARGGK